MDVSYERLGKETYDTVRHGSNTILFKFCCVLRVLVTRRRFLFWSPSPWVLKKRLKPPWPPWRRSLRSRLHHKTCGNLPDITRPARVLYRFRVSVVDLDPASRTSDGIYHTPTKAHHVPGDRYERGPNKMNPSPWCGQHSSQRPSEQCCFVTTTQGKMNAAGRTCTKKKTVLVGSKDAPRH